MASELLGVVLARLVEVGWRRPSRSLAAQLLAAELDEELGLRRFAGAGRGRLGRVGGEGILEALGQACPSCASRRAQRAAGFSAAATRVGRSARRRLDFSTCAGGSFGAGARGRLRRLRLDGRRRRLDDRLLRDGRRRRRLDDRLLRDGDGGVTATAAGGVASSALSRLAVAGVGGGPRLHRGTPEGVARRARGAAAVAPEAPRRRPRRRRSVAFGVSACAVLAGSGFSPRSGLCSAFGNSAITTTPTRMSPPATPAMMSGPRLVRGISSRSS